ncbi:MAG: hypothetical protein JXM73_01280 [Anaerolineae bacterium]|nr:hypothetical protein [Anaerolineae bacterium]
MKRTGVTTASTRIPAESPAKTQLCTGKAPARCTGKAPARCTGKAPAPCTGKAPAPCTGPLYRKSTSTLAHQAQPATRMSATTGRTG